ncbi:hypothetical protein D5086_021682 [Populus alba]|uniref:Uncharacterized protein n=1 Tax=Populus alba TaxID=43335 RepID=A0ACC4BEE5_POPAL
MACYVIFSGLHGLKVDALVLLAGGFPHGIVVVFVTCLSVFFFAASKLCKFFSYLRLQLECSTNNGVDAGSSLWLP